MTKFNVTTFFILFIALSTLAQHPALIILNGGASRVFTIPAGTSTMTIEAWGGGGGGSIRGGGQGGGYFKCTLPVQQNGQVQISVGLGGKGGSYNGTNGGYTTLDYTASPAPSAPVTYSFTAQGGAGSNSGAPLGGYSMSPNPDFGTPYAYEFKGYFGSNGYPSIVNAVSAYDSNFVCSSIGGSGGDGANSTSTKGIGGTESYHRIPPASPFGSNLSPISAATPASKGLIPGGGGGGAGCINQSNQGADGGDGQMIISYFY